MPNAPMTQCEEKRLYKVGDKKAWRWVEVPVTAIDGDGKYEIRCMHCHGQVKVKTQRVAGTPAGEVAHRSRVDSEHCRAGDRFAGQHSISSKPVE